MIREKGLTESQAQATVLLVRRAFPHNRIDPTSIDPAITLSAYTTDPDDEHIVTLAICVNADILVTADRGFRGAELQHDHGVRVRNPDAYLTELLAADGETSSICSPAGQVTEPISASTAFWPASPNRLHAVRRRRCPFLRGRHRRQRVEPPSAVASDQPVRGASAGTAVWSNACATSAASSSRGV